MPVYIFAIHKHPESGSYSHQRVNTKVPKEVDCFFTKFRGVLDGLVDLEEDQLWNPELSLKVLFRILRVFSRKIILD